MSDTVVTPVSSQYNLKCVTKILRHYGSAVFEEQTKDVAFSSGVEEKTGYIGVSYRDTTWKVRHQEKM